MLTDGHTVPSEHVVTTDVCVIGGGPAGIALARGLRGSGLEVLLLERGPWERTATPQDPDTAVSTGLRYHVDESRAFEIGGATQRWRVSTPLGRGFGRMRELDEQDFERRPGDTSGGWPFGKDHLQPFYAQARELFDCAWPSERPEEHWEKAATAGPFCDPYGTIRPRAFYFLNPAVFSAKHMRALVNADDVLVLTSSAALELCADAPGDRISGVVVKTAPHHRFIVRAGTYVLAAGGIESARILLASRPSTHPHGVGNDHDLVGRYFMEHPHYACGRVVPSSREVFEERAYFAITMADDVPVQVKYSLSDAVVEAEGLNRTVFRFEPKPWGESNATLWYRGAATRSLEAAGEVRSALRHRDWSSVETGALRDVVVGTPHLVRHGVHRLRLKLDQRKHPSRFSEPQQFWMRAMAEQTPNPDSRIRLLRQRDSLGVPKVALEWRLTDRDIISMQRSQALAVSALLQAGYAQAESLLENRSLPPALSGGNHHMGTTRMHDSPRQGVVDRNAKVHGVDNLYLCGSSVFPTSGYANPTLTVLALSLRLASYLRQRHHGQGV